MLGFWHPAPTLAIPMRTLQNAPHEISKLSLTVAGNQLPNTTLDRAHVSLTGSKGRLDPIYSFQFVQMTKFHLTKHT